MSVARQKTTLTSDEEAEMSSIKTGSSSEQSSGHNSVTNNSSGVGSVRQFSTNTFGPMVQTLGGPAGGPNGSTSEPNTPMGSFHREGSSFVRQSGSEVGGGGTGSSSQNNNKNQNNTSSVVIRKKKTAIKRFGSRLMMEEDVLEKKRLDALANGQHIGALNDDDDQGEENYDNNNDENPSTLISKVVNCARQFRWFINKNDIPEEAAKRISMIDHLLNSLTIGLPLFISIAVGLQEAITVGEESTTTAPVTAVVTVIAFALMTALPWAFWIGINIKNDMEYETTVKEHEEKMKAQQNNTNNNNFASALLENAMKKQRTSSFNSKNPGPDASNRTVPLSNASDSYGSNKYASMGLSGANVFGESGQVLSARREDTHHLGVNEASNNKDKDKDADERIKKEVPRPPINEIVIDILTLLMLCLSTTAGICWKGISICMLIVNIRIYSRGSRAASHFMLTKIHTPIFLAGSIYLLVKGAQESGLIDPSTTGIAASNAFLFQPSAAQDIVAIVVASIQLLMIVAYVNGGNLMLHLAAKRLKQFADQVKGKSKTLTHGEQHVAGGIVGNLVRLEIASAKKITEKYINSESPTILRGLSQLVNNMEQYVTFVPNWVKNPDAMEEEERLEQLETGGDDSHHHNTSGDETSETWSNNESSRSVLNSGVASLAGGSRYSSALTKENMSKIGHHGSDGKPNANNSNIVTGGGANAGVFGEYNLEYEDEKDDDIASVKEGDLDDGAHGGKGGGAHDSAAKKISAAASAGFAGKIVIATLEYNLNFKKYCASKRTESFSNNPLHQLPNSIPDAANNNDNNSNEGEFSQTDIEKKIIEKICGVIASSGGNIHSIVANKVIVSWNAMSRIAAPEHKAARFLVMSRKIATDKDSPFPGLTISGACMTGYGRALITGAASSMVSVLCVRWWRELEILGALAAQEDTLLCDLSTKHAVFLEFSVRGYGCLGSKNTMDIPKGDLKTTAIRGTLGGGAGGRSSALSTPHQKGIGRTPSMQNLQRSASSVVEPSTPSKERSLSPKTSVKDEFGSGAASATVNQLASTQSPSQHQYQQNSKDNELLAIFSIIGKRTGNNVEWMYLLQGGDEDSGAADPAAVSCSAMDHAAAANFNTAKQYVDQAVKLCENEVVELAKKIAELTQQNSSMTQRQRDEAEQTEEQQQVNAKSLAMFRKLSKRLDTHSTVESFPYKLMVI